jgi:F1F0 ATPase subunit 2
MNEISLLMLAGVAGAVLALFFFGGLSWTIAKGISSRHPALWFVCSLPIRSSVVMAGFYFIYSNHYERLLCCIVGFVAAGPLITWLMPTPSRVKAFETRG